MGGWAIFQKNPTQQKLLGKGNRAGAGVVFLGKTLFFSQCLSPLRCINGYRQI